VIELLVNYPNQVILMNMNNKKSNKSKNDYKAVCNSVIIESDQRKLKSKQRNGTRPDLNTLQRKFTVKSKKENDSLIMYNDDYKDHHSKKRQTINANKPKFSAGKKSDKDSLYEGRFSSRKPIKSHNGHKQSHKRSHSMNKSGMEQRYRSVPQSGHAYEHDNSKKHYNKKKLN